MAEATVRKRITVGEDGSVRLLGLPFSPGQEVRVTIEPVDAPSLLKRVAGIAQAEHEAGPGDAAERHDEYVYGPATAE